MVWAIRWARRHGDGPAPPAATSTTPANGSCAIRRCRSAPCRSTRRWRRSTAIPVKLDWEYYKDTLISSASRHRLLHHPCRRAARLIHPDSDRVTGVVSRGHSVSAMVLAHHREAFLYSASMNLRPDAPVDLVSLSDGLRGSIHDANGAARFAELDETLGELAKVASAKAAGDDRSRHVRLRGSRRCRQAAQGMRRGAVLYARPLVTNIARPTTAVGRRDRRRHDRLVRAAMFCYVTPKDVSTCQQKRRQGRRHRLQDRRAPQIAKGEPGRQAARRCRSAAPASTSAGWTRSTCRWTDAALGCHDETLPKDARRSRRILLHAARFCWMKCTPTFVYTPTA